MQLFLWVSYKVVSPILIRIFVVCVWRIQTHQTSHGTTRLPRGEPLRGVWLYLVDAQVLHEDNRIDALHFLDIFEFFWIRYPKGLIFSGKFVFSDFTTIVKREYYWICHWCTFWQLIFLVTFLNLHSIEAPTDQHVLLRLGLCFVNEKSSLLM